MPSSMDAKMLRRMQRLAAMNARPSRATDCEFKVGDRVKMLRSSDYSDALHNPHWGGNHGRTAGTVTDVDSDGECGVAWDNGTTNNCYKPGIDIELLKAKKRKDEQTAKLDLSKLDALILEPIAKNEITAVIKQHKNKDKLFTEWGLGDTIEYGRGMTFMFYGPPGTGKTWGATCIAKALGTELLSIGAAEIQSSEPGAANRNIQNAFKSAKEEGKVLLIDECDSLITSRADLGMVLAGEVNTLLTEIEKFEGVVILATNRIETMDEALERRISLIVEFPFPTIAQRKEIWAKLLPKKLPLSREVSIDALAAKELSGGQIKNVILQAARLALGAEEKTVSMAHFEAAVARILKSKNLMGTASRYRQGLVQDYGVAPKGVKDRKLDAFLDTDTK